MQVDQLSKLMQLYQMQNLSSSNSSASSDSSNPIFSMLLEQIMKNSSVQTSTNALSDTANGNGQAVPVSGIDGLTVDPQKLSKMLQISALENMLSSSSSNDVGNTSSVNDSSDDEIGSFQSENTDMTQLLDYILQSMNENQDTNNTATDASSNINLSNQTGTEMK